MKKLITLLLILGIILTGCSNENKLNSDDKINTDSNSTQNIQTEVDNTNMMSKVKSEKIEIVLFHGTVRCYSCNMMEELVKKTLEEKFKDKLDSGKITFNEINGEDPKNAEIINKYNVTGLSVFINGIMNGKDNIIEEKNLWRYIQNEEQFKTYLAEKLNNL